MSDILMKGTEPIGQVSEPIKKTTKRYEGINIANANGYVKISDYSDLPFVQSDVISVFIIGYNSNAVYQLQMYTDGIYLYSNTPISNGNITLGFVYM